MNQPSGLGRPEAKKKIWIVLQSVLQYELEDKLNEYAERGYQAFRVDRVAQATKDDDYFVVLFNPMLLGELNAAGMAEMLQKAGQAASNIAGPAPTTT